jgi:hypothetical protein
MANNTKFDITFSSLAFSPSSTSIGAADGSSMPVKKQKMKSFYWKKDKCSIQTVNVINTEEVTKLMQIN